MLLASALASSCFDSYSYTIDGFAPSLCSNNITSCLGAKAPSIVWLTAETDLELLLSSGTRRFVWKPHGSQSRNDGDFLGSESCPLLCSSTDIDNRIAYRGTSNTDVSGGESRWVVSLSVEYRHVLHGRSCSSCNDRYTSWLQDLRVRHNRVASRSC